MKTDEIWVSVVKTMNQVMRRYRYDNVKILYKQKMKKYENNSRATIIL